MVSGPGRAGAVLLLFVLLAGRLEAADWVEEKVGGLPCVTYESFCEFYKFTPVEISEKTPTPMKGVYGTLAFTGNARDASFNGRKFWMSYPFLKTANGRCYLSRLDVIKLLDPLLRRVEMAPRHPVKGVVIDPGHGGGDEGATSRNGYREKQATLDTALRLKAILSAQGIPTLMTRRSDVFIPLEERCDIANKCEDFIFISLHYNCGPSQAHGIETYSVTPQFASSTSDGSRQKRSDSEKQYGNHSDTLNILLADYIHREAIKVLSDESDRGLKRARFVVLRETSLPAVLLEGGFLSNSGDARQIVTAEYRQKLAEAVARGIKNYMALMNSPVGRSPQVMQNAPEKTGLTKKEKLPAQVTTPAVSGKSTQTAVPTPAPDALKAPVQKPVPSASAKPAIEKKIPLNPPAALTVPESKPVSPVTPEPRPSAGTVPDPASIPVPPQSGTNATVSSPLQVPAPGAGQASPVTPDVPPSAAPEPESPPPPPPPSFLTPGAPAVPANATTKP